MKILPYLFTFVLLISCTESKKEKDFFNKNLRTELLKYQNINPIPNENLYKLFIYEISFSKTKDTLLTITVSPTGIRSKNGYGIYKDKIIKPSYVIDSQNLGNRFVENYKKDSIELYTFEGTPPPHIDVIYPVYRYKLKGDKLIFIDSLR
ncbi:hypothetical protein [Chryseobacterium sp. NKUCC03_KSP]|uniref:hypothetical protein n=1 Tax=Chryseobacterium sp. NKUCC03_KSP TaxID=2842125 RepID=UPI001C5BEE5B|nr:hypothetical protein [Chryseobacterium sp. NKUCC03_KSP]MBW3523736.1 hypothetical protein [Chryseobacterium sp. NKUCC03_KSP]